MKKLIFILLFIPQIILADNYYVSTTGNNGNAGTIGSPWLTWQYGFNTIQKGDTLFIRGGTYTDFLGAYSSNYYGVRISGTSIHDGTASQPIVVMAYPGETPILDGSSMIQDGGHFGINLEGCDYWYVKGLTVAYFTEHQNVDLSYDLAGSISGEGTYITFNQCVAHDCGNGFAFGNNSNYIYYTNCDSYQNFDHSADGGYANGFNGNINIGNHLFFEGCRAWTNSDDGFDVFQYSPLNNKGGYITFNNCWAWDNGQMGGEIGDGAGFKLGDAGELTKESGVQRTITNCLSFDNHGCGIDESMDYTNDGTIVDINVYNNTCYDNFHLNYNFSLHTVHSGIVHLTNNISYLDGDYGDNIRNEAHLIQTTNSWQGGISVSGADFVSLVSAGVDGVRQANGDLPNLNFLKLVIGSDLIDAGTNVGLAFSGDAPDLGAYENGSVTFSIPTVTTSAITDITATTATGGGNVTDDGGSLVGGRGICWSTSLNPTTSNHRESAGTGTGVFIAYLTNLESGLTYYVRAYATNSTGTAYGLNEVFTASATPPPPGPTHFVTHKKLISSGGKLIRSK